MENRNVFINAIKLVLPFVGLLLLIGLGVYLVNTKNLPMGEKVTIRWVVDPHPIRKESITLFEKKHPNIHVINDPDAGPQRLLTQIAGDVPPDVMAIYEPSILYIFAQNDLLLDLSPYVKEYNIPVDDLYPQLDPYVRVGKKIVGIPENCGTYVVFYNKKLFREAGVPYPRPGWTWDECLDSAKKLTKYRVVNGRKVAVQKGIYIADSMANYFAWINGGSMFSPDGKKCIVDSEAAKKGMRFFADMKLKYRVIPSASEAQSMAPTGGYGGDLLLFAQGKVAMVIVGRWLISEYRLHKDLEWATTAMPISPNHVVPFTSKCYAIPKNCKHKKEAIQFICHLLSRDNEDLVASYGDGLPTRRNKQIVKDFLYDPKYPKETSNQLYIDELKWGRITEWSHYIDNTDVNAIVGMEVSKMWLGSQGPDETCDKIAMQINDIINRNLANPNFLR
ncbi:MAG: sugar ABC transporter substrate-binding protein [Armatimonadota bacterium]|nr:sugar ABC transporter substrate-binding protein [bacterium]